MNSAQYWPIWCTKEPRNFTRDTSLKTQTINKERMNTMLSLSSTYVSFNKYLSRFETLSVQGLQALLLVKIS